MSHGINTPGNCRWRLLLIVGLSVACAPLACEAGEASRSRQEATAGSSGLLRITRGGADLPAPPAPPPEQIWRYGMGMPFQAGPMTAWLFCNIGRDGTPGQDFEMGTDVVLFDDLGRIDPARAVAIARVHEEFNPRNRQAYIVAKYTMRGGFVPLGAKRTDGTAHPHAGTGFGICEAVGFRKDMGTKPYRDPDSFHYIEFHQFSYDGNEFRVLNMERRRDFELGDGWKVYLPGMTAAVADGDDLLFAMAGRKPGFPPTAGVARFQRKANAWQPVSFTAVTGPPDAYFEPSLARDNDGRLVFSARGPKTAIEVWKQDGANAGKALLHAEGVRSATPVVLGRAADGTPYIIGNDPRHYREILQVWPLDGQRTGLESPIVVRAPADEFGPTPQGDSWFVDIPSAGVVRLADGRWHGVLTHRLCTRKEVEGGGLPAPQTGCYVEEVFSTGQVLPEWRFE